ncbi:MAG: class I SAM-dependent methyltransferase [Flavobacteriales bacterium]|nr:class I SAM-dependent methyltransferase [Flavobacteriales bacterium]
MQNQKNILDCYNKTAVNYAEKFKDEFEWKHFDKLLLGTFCKENLRAGRMIDLGCGPGQSTKFVYDSGLKNILGTDLSEEMVKVASNLFPEIEFETADMLKLNYSESTFGSAIAFYSIVHFDYSQVRRALSEVKRVLIPKGQILFSFHVGDEIIELNSFLEKEVQIKFRFFEVNKIKEILLNLNYEILDIVLRDPYPAEHPSNRAYIWVRNGKLS